MENKDTCSFCGRSDIKLLYGVTGCICENCLKLGDKYINDSKTINNKDKIKDIPKPLEIKKFLDKYVIGQDRVKERVAVAVYNHYKRINNNDNNIDDVEIEKSNILIVGNSGSGKTLIASTIAKMLNVPFAVTDATSLTQAGYVGEDVENVLVNLYQAADYDVEKTERGIVFIDEIDKIASKGNNVSITRDVSGEGVQQGLLKLLEGSIVNIPPRGGRKHPDQEYIKINTKNILFICGGAFVGIEKKIERRCKKNVIGFDSIDKNNKLKDENFMKNICSLDLKSYGLIPEIIGRLPVITYTDELDENSLIRILKEPKNAITKQYKKLFELDGINLTFTEGALKYIAEKSIENKIGARGLRVTMENVMNSAMLNSPSSNIKDIKVDLKYVKKELKDYA